jgi:hypothetical protein
LLESLGYWGSFFCKGHRYPLIEFDPAEHQRLDPNTDRLPPGYVNNFAFEREVNALSGSLGATSGRGVMKSSA